MAFTMGKTLQMIFFLLTVFVPIVLILWVLSMLKPLEVQYLSAATYISLASLLIALSKYASPLVIKPRLRTTFLQDDPNTIVEATVDGTQYRWVRVKIENGTGIFTSTAYGVYLKNIGVVKDNKTVKPLNPFIMRWTSSDNRTDTEDMYIGDLGSGEFEYLNLCTNYEHNSCKSVLVPGVPFSVGNKRKGGQGLTAQTDECTFGDGKYTYTIGIYGKNISGVTKEFTIHFDNNAREPIKIE